MVEIGSALAILGAGIGGHKVIERILGPTADYIGEGLRGQAEKSVNNLKSIFARASDVLGDEASSGHVPPRVLKAVLDEGSMADSHLVQCYLGGVLAASRTDDGEDDRSVTLARLCGRLSSYQMRTHYFIYSSIHKAQAISIRGHRDMATPNHLHTMVMAQDYFNYMSLPDPRNLGTHDPQISSLQANRITHAFEGLVRERLVAPDWVAGQRRDLAGLYEDTIDSLQLIFCPDLTGFELFSAAHGHPDFSILDFYEARFPEIDHIEFSNPPRSLRKKN